ncbi:MAG: cysteine synthase family protein, partial [Ruminococcaceae bacterium]|nr:cysteine synthase family protein [Oscillospiraceae bacterium]
MKIAKNFSELIGHTPMLELCKIEEEFGLKAKIFAKLEGLNPGGSIKDRVACSMIDEAEKNGMLKPNSLIIEPTSGNTGIGLAAVAAERGYRCIIIMPDTMSIERRAVLKALGAELILIDGALGMTGCIAKAKELLEENPGSFMPAQFKNPANPLAHILTTGPEMFEQT